MTKRIVDNTNRLQRYVKQTKPNQTWLHTL